MMRKTTILCAIGLLLAWQPKGVAQTECFDYEDPDAKTIVRGIVLKKVIETLQEEGKITIPSCVETVRSNALGDIKAYNCELNQLAIEGTPTFEEDEDGKNALAALNDRLETVAIYGTAMAPDYIATLLDGCDNTGKLQKLDIYDDEFPTDICIVSAGIRSHMRVVLPVARVGSQTFANKESGDDVAYADVYGRFTLTSASGIASYCGNLYFEDTDDGSHFLFYIATGIESKNEENMLHIQRVRYLLPGEGVLMHKLEYSSGEVALKRVTEDDVPYATTRFYESNMLCGVTEPKTIGSTETVDGTTYTNWILYQGTFYRTSGGTIGANRAYLRVPQAQVSSLSRLAQFFDDDESAPTGIGLTSCPSPKGEGYVYDLQGRKVAGSLRPGIYVHQGKKIFVR